MCLACEQDAIWLAYLESKGLLNPDDPAAVEKLFADFPMQPLPMQADAATGFEDEPTNFYDGEKTTASEPSPSSIPSTGTSDNPFDDEPTHFLEAKAPVPVARVAPELVFEPLSDEKRQRYDATAAALLSKPGVYRRRHRARRRRSSAE